MENNIELLGVKLTFEEFDMLMCEQSKGKELGVIDGKVVAIEREIVKDENYYRILRQPLLTAFDKYKTNVVYGIELETQEERTKLPNSNF